MNDFWKYDTSAFTDGSASTYLGTTGTWNVISGSAAVDQVGVYTAAPSFLALAPTQPLGRTHPETSGSSAVSDTTAHGTSVILNDLWEYNGTAWTWVSGGTTNLVSQNGKYGTQGVAAATNMPGGRHEAAGWADAHGNLWLFGGEGNDSVGTTHGILNDLWVYNIASNQWTWVGGSNLANVNGTYPNNR